MEIANFQIKKKNNAYFFLEQTKFFFFGGGGTLVNRTHHSITTHTQIQPAHPDRIDFKVSQRLNYAFLQPLTCSFQHYNVLGCLRSNLQNSHRFLFVSVRPFNHSDTLTVIYCLLKTKAVDFIFNCDFSFLSKSMINLLRLS